MKTLLSIVFLIALSAQAGPIEDLAANTWYEVPNSRMSAVDPCPAQNCAYSAVEGFAAVMNDWSGGAFDTKRNNLIVWGGGHGGYAGNEIYTFNLDSLKWKRENNPSNPPALDVPYASDGGPCSRHTYDYIQYVASIDRFCSFGGAGFYQSGQTGTSHTDGFNFDAKTWSAYADCPCSGIGAISAYDPLTGHAWGKGTGYSPSYDLATALSEWNPATNVWTRRDNGNADLAYEYYLTAAIDPVNRKFVAAGNGKTVVWNISNTASITRTDLSSGPSAASPGMDYESNAKKLVAWSSGQSVNVFDGATNIWSTQAGSGATPTPPNSRGTFGRFRYCPAKNVFVVVNNTDENVFLYRFSAGTGTAVRTLPAGITPAEIAVSPNPFRSSVSIRLPKGAIACSIHDLNGRLLKQFVPGAAGALTWNAGSAPTGLYLLRAEIKGKMHTQRLLLQK